MVWSGGAGWNQEVSLDGTYDGVSGNIEELSVGTDGTFHTLFVCELNHAMTSSRGAGWNQEASSAADTVTMENPIMRRIPNARPILAILFIFIVIPLVIL
jgi:hypothetical protein